MSEQGQSPVLTVYHCPKCGSESLERDPCVFDRHTGYSHGHVQREPVEYVAIKDEIVTDKSQKPPRPR